MSPGLETEQMWDTKGKRLVDSLKLGNSLANCLSSVANVIFAQLPHYQRCFPGAFTYDGGHVEM